MKKPFAFIIQWPFWVGDFWGFSFAPFVFVKDKNNEMFVRHELIHIRQQYNHFIVWFWLRYLYQLLIVGYKNIDYEIEAYREQNNKRIWHDT